MQFAIEFSADAVEFSTGAVLSANSLVNLSKHIMLSSGYFDFVAKLMEFGRVFS